MSNYYKTNAIYNELERRSNTQLVWVSGNAWILLYADIQARVQVISFVTGSSVLRAAAPERVRLELAREKAAQMAADAKVNFATIHFEDDTESIDKVILNGTDVSLVDLKDWFARAGLPVQGQSTTKAINDASSSAYHNWQRANLGLIKVSDLDLMRLDITTGKVIEIVELKRSFQSLASWRPYPADFPNFNVVANLASRIGARFKIAYNLRETKPVFRDDASRLSLFNYSPDRGATAIGIVSLDEFVRGNP